MQESKGMPGMQETEGMPGMHELRLRALPELFAVCRLPPATALPAWALAARPFCIAASDEELSIVCPAIQVPALPPPELRVEAGWRALVVRGPLDFALTGILARLTGALAVAAISVFAFSTYDTDYLLVRADRLADALAALRAAGVATD
jgi:hypothetical protein